MGSKIVKTNAEWEKQLTPQQYYICRQKGTEAPFSGKYNNEKRVGNYTCICCNEELFSSDSKYDSNSGWPSFWQPIEEHRVIFKRDFSHGMVRTEVMCARCESHLGHVFEDGPQPSGLRYCLNSVSLNLIVTDPEK